MRVRAAVLIALVVGSGGCGSPASIAFNITRADSVALPDSLRVTLFAAGKIGAQTVPLASAGKSLPGTLVVSPVDAAQPGFRWLVEGLDALGVVRSQAAAFATLAAGAQTSIAVTLGAPLTDSDGDGVPDTIDDCSSTPDPEQRCALPGDLGVPDGGVLCPAGAILCEDFESGSVDTNGWTVSNVHNGDSVTVDGVRPHSGALSLHAVGTAQGQGHIAAIDHTFSPPPSFAVREWLYLESTPGADAFFLQLYTSSIGVSLGSNDDGTWKVVEDFGSSTTDHTSSVAMTLAGWTCLEFVVTRPAGSGQRFQAYADNQLVTDFLPGDNYVFTDIYVGFARVPPNGATTLFLDDVAVAPARIGCP